MTLSILKALRFIFIAMASIILYSIKLMIIAYPDITITKSITFQPSLKYVLKSNASPIATILIRASTKKMNVITKFSMSMALFLFVKESRS